MALKAGSALSEKSKEETLLGIDAQRMFHLFPTNGATDYSVRG